MYEKNDNVHFNVQLISLLCRFLRQQGQQFFSKQQKTVVPELSDEQKARMKASMDKMNEERKKVFTTPMKWMKTPEKS